MANLSRFLPIVGIAVAGVLAMKVITSAGILPDMFHKAEAVAADSSAKAQTKATHTKAKSGKESDSQDDPTQSYSVASTAQATDANASAKDAAAVVPVAGGPTTPVCATSVNELAKEAGISPNELQILQSLGQRRSELDQREAQLDSRAQLMQAADDKLDSRITQLTTLKGQIQALIDQANKTGDDDTNRMIKVYEAMKPKDAAAVITPMSDDVRLPIAAGMKDRALAAVLAAMPPDAARELTEKLANRMKSAGGLQDKLDKMAGVAAGNAKPGTPSNGNSASSAPPAKKAPASAKSKA